MAQGGSLSWQRISAVCLLTILIVSLTKDVAAMSDEKRLIKHLLEEYEMVGVFGRPVFNTSQTINVQYGLALIQILDLDEKNQVLTTNVWSRYAWTDILLTWNPEDYGGVDHVRVPVAKIWTPDIVLYNYADERLKEHRETMAVVSSDGTVLWIPPAIFKSACSIDIRHFPFDVQTCHLKFGSWTYDGYKLDISFYADQASFDISDYVDSNEWALIEYPAKKNVKYYTCCLEPYTDLTFTIKVKRIAAFYNYIIILPCVLLSSLTLVIFWLPPESPAKMMLGMNIFVAFFVLLLLLADNTPPATPSIPLIGAYFCMNMILITLSTFLAIIVINTHIRGDRKNKVPEWLKRVTIDGLASILCMQEYLDPKPTNTPHQHQPHPQHHPQQKQQQQRKSSTVNETTSLTVLFRPSQRNGGGGGGEVGGGGGEMQETKRPDQLRFTQFQPSSVMKGELAANVAIATAEDSSEPSSSSASTIAAAAPVEPAAEAAAASSSLPISITNLLEKETLEQDAHEIKVMLKAYLSRLGDKDANAKVMKEWRIVARVLDRLFFFIYCATIVISLATIFPRGE